MEDEFDIVDGTEALMEIEARNQDEPDEDNLEDDEAEIGDEEEVDQEQPDESDDPEELEDEADDDSDESDFVHTLADGTQLTLAELEAGYLRHSDYTKKTQATSEREAKLGEFESLVMQRAQEVANQLDGLEGFVQSLIPQPNPNMSNEEYMQAVRLRDAVTAELESLKAQSQQAKNTVQQFSAEDMARAKAEEEGKLLEALPGLKDPAKRMQFNARIQNMGEAFGYTKEDVEAVTDSRLLRILDLAAQKFVADRNQKAVRRRKANPTKGKRRQTAAATGPKPLSQAMKRLQQSGDFEAAVQLLK